MIDRNVFRKIKYLLILVLTVVLTMPYVSVSADSMEPIVNQNFESSDSFFNSREWSISDDCVKITGSPTLDGNVLEIPPTQYAAYTLANVINSDIAILSVDFFVKDFINARPITVWDEKNTSGNAFVRLEIDTQGRIMATDAEYKKVFVGMYALNRWTNLTLYADNKNMTYRVFINGCAASAEISFSNATPIVYGINTIEMQNGGNDSSLYLDNFFVERSKSCDDADKIINDYMKYSQRIEYTFDGINDSEVADVSENNPFIVSSNGDARYVRKNSNTYIHSDNAEKFKCVTDSIQNKKYYAVSYDFRTEKSRSIELLNLYGNDNNPFVQISVDDKGVFSINGLNAATDSGVLKDNDWNNICFFINLDEKYIEVYLNGVPVIDNSKNLRVGFSETDIKSVCTVEVVNDENEVLDIDNISVIGFNEKAYGELYLYMFLCTSDRSIKANACVYLKFLCGNDVPDRLETDVCKGYEYTVNEHKEYRTYADAAEVVYKENFNLFEDNYPMHSVDGDMVAENAVVVSGALQVGSDNNNGRFLKYKRQFDDLTVSFDFKQSVKSAGKIYSLSDLPGKKSVMLISSNGQDIKLMSGSSDTPVVILNNYDVNRWYNIRIITSIKNKNFTIFIDGNKIGEFKFLDSDIANFGRVFDCTEMVGAFYDNIEVLKYFAIKAVALKCGTYRNDALNLAGGEYSDLFVQSVSSSDLSSEEIIPVVNNEAVIPKKCNCIGGLKLVYGWKIESGIVIIKISDKISAVENQLYNGCVDEASSVIPIDETNPIVKIDVYYWKQLQTLIPITKNKQINIKYATKE